jgi:hypothetical protein
MIRTLSALAMATALLLFSSAGATTDTITMKVFGYLPISDLVLADPVGLEPAHWFQRSPQTSHVAGPPPTQFPPSPCRVHATTWNNIVNTIPESAAEGATIGDTTYVQFSIVIGFMAISQCRVEVVRDASAFPDRLVSIRPVP